LRRSRTARLAGMMASSPRLVTYQYLVSGVATISLSQTWTARDQLATQTRYKDVTGTSSVGTTSYGYDNAGRETNLQFKDGSGNNISNFTYSYDPGSRLTAETLAVATLTASTTSYQYDADNQLTQGGTLTYGYDANGNRKNTGYTTGTGNQLTNDGTWTYTYDSEGNLTKKSKGSLLETWTYGYDNLHHLVWAEDRQTDGGSLITRMDYKYDVLGNRIDLEVTANSVTTATHFAYDGQNAWADLSGTNVLQMRRLYTDAVDALFARIASSGTVAWYLTDREGSVRDIANNSTGASIDHLDYDGFGNATETQSSNGDRYKYTARELDAVTKQQYNRGRYYDPGTGRWTSEDPIGFNAGDSNLYRYVGNNPTDATDPSGFQLKKPPDIIDIPEIPISVDDLPQVIYNELVIHIGNLVLKGKAYDAVKKEIYLDFQEHGKGSGTIGPLEGLNGKPANDLPMLLGLDEDVDKIKAKVEKRLKKEGYGNISWTEATTIKYYIYNPDPQTGKREGTVRWHADLTLRVTAEDSSKKTRFRVITAGSAEGKYQDERYKDYDLCTPVRSAGPGSQIIGTTFK
jgi:RHS repeat-associated protein